MNKFNENQKRFLIYLYFPGKWVIKVITHENSTLKELKNFITSDQIVFLHNGIKLLESISFSLQGLKNGDYIIIISKEKQNQQISNFLQNKDFYHKKIQSIINPSISIEIAKLHDLQNLKIEKKSRTFRKICNLYKNNNLESKNFSPLKSNINYFQPQEPSILPLPCFWNSTNIKDINSSSYLPLSHEVSENPNFFMLSE